MGLDAPWHWIILALIVVALFGYKRMPEMARSVAQSLRIFKTEIKGMTGDAPAPAVDAAPTAPVIAPSGPASVPTAVDSVLDPATDHKPNPTAQPPA
jgi:sec-independent protein translocase protein TatA